MSTPTFINKSGLPVNLETWQSVLLGLESLTSVVVKSGEQIVLPSTTGEWYIQTYLDKEFADEWKAAGYSIGSCIGKFRNKPCLFGEYSWIYNEHFDLIYDKENCTATFIKK
jgi:hypothetical protein